MALEFKLPELGENIEHADVLEVFVKKGDTVEVDQPVLEIETDKATIEVPSDVAGLVKEVRVKAGDTADVGQVVLVLEAVAAQTAPAETPSEPAVEEPAPAKPGPPSTASQQLQPAPRPPVQVVSAAPRPVASNGATSQTGPRPPAPAAPSTRRMAREIGVDINQVNGTGPGGRISVEDVKAHAKALLGGSRTATAGGAAMPLEAPPLPDFSRWGEIRREKMSGIRRKTAQQMAMAWRTIPQVTQFDKADIGQLEVMRKQMNERSQHKITVTAILLKVLASALKRFPQFNASLDLGTEEIVYKSYYNVGVAVDTERGLLVPVVKDAYHKNVLELAGELDQIARRARDRKIGPDELAGSCITITNLGGIGGHAFTPIVNPPEVAILGVSRSSQEPVYVDGKFRARLMLPLCLSYDHRLIDGADAARFLRWVCEALENPAVLAFEG